MGVIMTYKDLNDTAEGMAKRHARHQKWINFRNAIHVNLVPILVWLLAGLVCYGFYAAAMVK